MKSLMISVLSTSVFSTIGHFIRYLFYLPWRGPRWRRLLALGTYSCFLFILLFPWLISRPASLQLLVSQVFRDFPGKIKINSAAMMWWQQIELEQIDITDLHDQSLLSIASVKVHRSPLELLWDPSNLGTIEIDQPCLHLVFDGKSSNLQETITALKKKFPNHSEKQEKSKNQSPIAIELHGGSISYYDSNSGQKGELEHIEASFSKRAEQGLHLQASAEMTSPKLAQSGTITLEAHQKITSGLELELDASQFSLAFLSPFLAEFTNIQQIAGELSGKFAIKIDSENNQIPQQVSIQSSLIVDQGFIEPRNSREKILFHHLELPCSLRWQDEKIVIDDWRWKSDFATWTASGTIQLKSDWLQILESSNLSSQVQIDLAQLGRYMPLTLQIHPELDMKSGILTANMQIQKNGSASDIQFHSQCTDIVGTIKDRTIHWRRPITLDVACRSRGSDLPSISQCDCQSDFFQLRAQGDSTRFSCEANWQFQTLMDHLREFIHNDKIAISGKGSLQGTWSTPKKNLAHVELHCLLSDLQITVPGKPLCTESDGQITVNVAGKWENGHLLTLDSGGLTAQLGKDGLGLYIQSPCLISEFPFNSGQIQAHLVGNSETWQRRIHFWTDALADWKVTGPIDSAANVVFSPQKISWSKWLTRWGHQTQSMSLITPEFHLALPLFQLESSSGSFDLKTLELALVDTNFESEPLSLQSKKCSFKKQKGNYPFVEGDGIIHANLKTVSSWFGDKVSEAMEGMVAGSIQVLMSAQQLRLRGELLGQKMAWHSNKRTIWQDAEIQCKNDSIYDFSTSGLKISRLFVRGTGIALDLAGEIDASTPLTNLDLSGQIQYNWDLLQPNLRQSLGNSLVIHGKETKAIHLQGSLQSLFDPSANINPKSLTAGQENIVKGSYEQLHQNLYGNFGLGWNSLELFGCEIGKVDLSTRMIKGKWQLNPISTTINQGKLNLQSSVAMIPSPGELWLGAGTVIDHAMITPKMTNSALGYMAPLIAGVGQAEGELSLQLENSHIPLHDTNMADIYARLILHRLKVEPSPVLKELGVLFNGNVKSLTIASENTIPIRVVNRRIYHDQMRLQMGNILLTSSGSVGMDGSLNLLIEMPIPPSWLNSPILKSSFGNRLIKIPVQGTIHNPKIDRKTLEYLTKQFIERAGKNALQKELQNQFDRFLPLQKP